MKKEYAGMTGNERLFVAGLLEKFDTARMACDAAAMKAILLEVGLLEEGDANEEAIIQTFLKVSQS